MTATDRTRAGDTADGDTARGNTAGVDTARGNTARGDMAGRVVLVTGGAHGVGAAISRHFARRGAHVVVNCFHSLADGRALVAELALDGGSAECVRASVGRPEQVATMFAGITRDHGRLDVLVNNSAMGTFAAADDTTGTQLDRAFEVNVKGALDCARAARPLLVAAGGGAIVNLSSVGSGLTVGNYLSVGTTKAALESMTRYLAVEWAPDGIRVNTASGGLIEGDVAGRFPDADGMAEVVRAATPLGALGTAEDLADLVGFLASPASRWITGQTIVADGGLSLGGALLTPRSHWRTRDTGPAQPVQPTSDAGPATATAGHVQSAPAALVVRDRPVEHDPIEQDAVAIVGMGIVVPGASDPEAFWEVLRDGPDLVRPDRPDRFRSEFFFSPDTTAEDKTYQVASGYVDDYQPGAELTAELGPDRRTTDYPTQWFRHAVRDAVRGVDVTGNVACVAGYTADGNQHLEESMVVRGVLDDLVEQARELGWDADRLNRMQQQARQALLSRYPLYAASGVSPMPFAVGNDAIRGVLPGSTQVTMVDTACSSALYALDIAAKGILEGVTDVAVCGGTFCVGPRNAVLFAKLHGLSRSGRLRPLDAACDGVLFSDGAAAVTLKRADRARRDGDRVLGYLRAMGTSSDGKGKAIYAPNVVGQKLAIHRATGVGRPAVDWVVAHATGTPAGDLCEISSIRSALPPAEQTLVTSNKSLIGHTGWAAGVVSLIQVLTSLQREQILPQHNFTETPAAYQLAGTQFRVPTEVVRWPARRTPRVAAVSGFGFGGTNAHLLVQDRAAALPRPVADDVVVTAWAADLPGRPDGEALAGIVSGRSPGKASFGDVYDTAGLALRMPPRVLRTLDRCQLIAIACAADLRRSFGDAAWEQLRERTGVFVGHQGPTRNAFMYGKRCHIDNAFDAMSGLPDELFPTELREGVRARIRGGVVASNEDSFPGIMPNVISARISNYFDTRGPNMTIDLGIGAALGALQTAARYLRAGDIDAAIAGGIHGNSSAVLSEQIGDSLGVPVRLAEGGFLFGLVRRETATTLGLPVLGVVGELSYSAPDTAADGPADRSVGHPAVAGQVLWGGAEAARAVLDVLLHEPGGGRVTACDGADSPRLTLSILSADASSVPPASGATGHQDRDAATPAEPATTPAELVVTPAESTLVQRWVPTWVSSRAEPVREPLAAFPSDAVVLTDSPERLDGLGLSEHDPLVLSVVPTAGPRRRVVDPDDPASLEAALAGLTPPVRHLRLLTDLESRLPAATALTGGDPATTHRLHDLLFLVTQRFFAGIADATEPGSVLLLVQGGCADGAVHPFASLFTGFAKSLSLEMPTAVVSCVLTSADDTASALGQLVAESAARQLLPVVRYDRGRRSTLCVRPEPTVPAVSATAPDAGAPGRPLDADSVVVATAGARGVTSEVLIGVAERYRPHVYTIGSTPLAALQARLAEIGGPSALGNRADFLRAARVSAPGRSVRELNAEYERLDGAVAMLANLARMEAACGPGKVHYLQADVTDRAALHRALDTVRDRHERIDLVVHGAGINRAGAVPNKPLASFRAVRDVKVGGYLNLRSATADLHPRMWASFSSLIGLTGQRGEVDYAAANDFLGAAAAHGRAEGIDEFAIGWTLWKEAGMAADSVHQSFFTGAMANVLSLMPTAEGVEHFLAELAAGNRQPWTVHIGEVEHAAIESLVPGYFAPREPDTAAGPGPEATPGGAAGATTGPEPAIAREPARGRFYLDGLTPGPGGRLVGTRVFDDRDRFLDGHLVGGVGTLPGCFVAELVASVALAANPGLVCVGLRDLRFSHFVKLNGPASRSGLRITATPGPADGVRTAVDVVVSGDTVAPNGTVLARDRVYYSGRAVLANEYPQTPRPAAWPVADEDPIIDPYHSAGSPVLLAREFVTTARTRLHPLGKLADHVRSVPPDSVYEQFVVPTLLLDGLARLAVLHRVGGRFVPVAAPTAIARIDLYGPENDADLSRSERPLTLAASPSGLVLGTEPGTDRFTAAWPDGSLVVQMRGLEGVVLGHVDARTGERADPAEVAAAGEQVGSRLAAVAL